MHKLQVHEWCLQIHDINTNGLLECFVCFLPIYFIVLFSFKLPQASEAVVLNLFRFKAPFPLCNISGLSCTPFQKHFFYLIFLITVLMSLQRSRAVQAGEQPGKESLSLPLSAFLLALGAWACDYPFTSSHFPWHPSKDRRAPQGTLTPWLRITNFRSHLVPQTRSV